ncbi:MAG: GGDEF domain-containing protein, partial [Acidobacteriota bacterium]|nr:GGDEF domain-containing protein [Acidobacteriota bacterium]
FRLTILFTFAFLFTVVATGNLEEAARQPPPPASRERRPVLVLLRGDQPAAPISLEREEVLLGRALEADVRINDVRASRLHARILAEKNPETGATEYHVRDLNSTNGTFVNGHPVIDAALRDGDKLQIGDHLLRFEMLDDTESGFQRRVHRLLAHDELTGLLTSKSFFSELRREATRAASEGQPFCVLMMDLDHFKEVNDRYGHLVGSQTIEEVSGILAGTLRTGDVAARFGSEEFAAYLSHTDDMHGLIIAERVRRAVESHRFSATRRGSPADIEQPLNITISIGLAAFPGDARDPIELVELADMALDHAKRNGRNRVATHCDAPPNDKTQGSLMAATVPGSQTAPPAASDRPATEDSPDSAITTIQTDVDVKNE